jgi:hypothetical protein
MQAVSHCYFPERAETAEIESGEKIETRSQLDQHPWGHQDRANMINGNLLIHMMINTSDEDYLLIDPLCTVHLI